MHAAIDANVQRDRPEPPVAHTRHVLRPDHDCPLIGRIGNVMRGLLRPYAGRRGDTRRVVIANSELRVQQGLTWQSVSACLPDTPSLAGRCCPQPPAWQAQVIVLIYVQNGDGQQILAQSSVVAAEVPSRTVRRLPEMRKASGGGLPCCQSPFLASLLFTLPILSLLDAAITLKAPGNPLPDPFTSLSTAAGPLHFTSTSSLKTRLCFDSSGRLHSLLRSFVRVHGRRKDEREDWFPHSWP